MAWEAVSKENVAALSGIRTTALRDEWYDFAVGLIGKIAGIYNIGTPIAVVEIKDGNGSSVMQVDKPPISAVEKVVVDGVTMSSALVKYSGSSVYLSDSGVGYQYTTNPRIGNYIFSKGIRNVEITYTSGTLVSDEAYALAVSLVVKEFANLATAEGSDSRLQFYKPGQSGRTEKPLYEWGLHGKIKGIIISLLGEKKRIR